ncbi:MAG: S24 family peptidase, partial [Sphingopyxis sp.]|nr:S24 family peptidase [Sphingopyxis sp.]
IAEGGDAMMAFDPRWLRRLSATPKALSIIRVAGDSMAPTLNDGDDIMVDQGDGVGRLRDGIYVLRRDETLLVKRLARGAARDTVSIISDNTAYPSDPHVAIADLSIVGRVVWAGRRLG